MSGAETLHAGCVAIEGRGVLIAGGSGRGKSDLALRLIDRGAALVSDDYTSVRSEGGKLIASPPAPIAGKIEIRGVGIVELAYLAQVPVCLLVDLDGPVPRLPAEEQAIIAGVGLPRVAVAALETSAPLKLEQALHRFGLHL